MALAALMVAACAAGGDRPAPGVAVVGATEESLAAIDARNVAYVTGTVSYPQRIALPKDAVVVVDLIDFGGGGSAGAGTLIARKRFVAGGQVPINFELPYDRTRVVPSQAYGVRARILVDGALWFLDDRAVAVLTRGSPATAEFVLRPARASE